MVLRRVNLYKFYNDETPERTPVYSSYSKKVMLLDGVSSLDNNGIFLEQQNKKCWRVQNGVIRSGKSKDRFDEK